MNLGGWDLPSAVRCIKEYVITRLYSITVHGFYLLSYLLDSEVKNSKSIQNFSVGEGL